MEQGWAAAVVRHAPLAIGALYGSHVVLRVATGGSLGLDDAEMMVAAQALDWGYGPQPPLYAWAQHAVFALTGPTLLGLALLKNLFLASALLAVLAAARIAGAGAAAAAVAAFSMLWMPGFAWEAQRALTHTPLAVATGAAALALFLHLRRAPGAGAHVAFGVVLGLAVLSKPNAALLAGALLATLLFWPSAPRHRVVLAALIGAAMATPTLLWSLARLSLVMRDVDPPGPGGWWAGLAALAGAAAALVALPMAGHAVLFWRRVRAEGAPPATAAARADLARVLAIAAGAVVLTVVVSGQTAVKERWLVPVVFPAMLLAALWAERAASGPRLAWFLRLTGVLVLAVAVVLPVNWQAGRRNLPHENAPFAALGSPAVGDAATVLAASNWIGGNLRRDRPRLGVLTPQMPDLGIEAARPARLVWLAADGDSPPQALAALMHRRYGPDAAVGPVERIEAPGGWRGRQSLALHVAPVR